MKKFTKIILVIAAVLSVSGIAFISAAAVMGASLKNLSDKALNGEFDFGNWHFADGFYYEKRQDAGTESCKKSYDFSDVASLKLELDAVEQVIFEVSESTEEIEVEMEHGFENYFSTKKSGDCIEVLYESEHYTIKHGPTITIRLPKQCSGLSYEIIVGVGTVDVRGGILQAEQISLSLGVGDISVKQVCVNGMAQFEVGTGDMNFSGGTYEKMKIDSGVGDVHFDAAVLEKLEIETGLGDISVQLPEKENAYDYEISAGIGEISLNGNKKQQFFKAENDGIMLELTSGTGDISVSAK